MRAREDPTFMDFLMRIGNGKESTNANTQIQLLIPIVISHTTHDESLDTLVSYLMLSRRPLALNIWEQQVDTIDLSPLPLLLATLSLL
ncbi:hypothetical protein LIER_23251 [Lithospermum erythrorhizon]|uniref:Uncharacterized protein n=1 Tax=Lithospermum erythrorhizon TaxID=34254 RepID=A0AAV3QY43_LITER